MTEVCTLVLSEPIYYPCQVTFCLKHLHAIFVILLYVCVPCLNKEFHMLLVVLMFTLAISHAGKDLLHRNCKTASLNAPQLALSNRSVSNTSTVFPADSCPALLMALTAPGNLGDNVIRNKRERRPGTLLLRDTQLEALQLCLLHSNVLIFLIDYLRHIPPKIPILPSEEIRMLWMEHSSNFRK